MAKSRIRIMFTVFCTLGVSLPAPAQDASTPRAEKTHENVVFGMHGGLALLMDVYQPEESNGHALIYINGTGWHTSPRYDGYSLKDFPLTEIMALPLVEQGFTVFAINHRTAPTFRYPAAIDDARRAVRFIRHHSADYGLTEPEIAAFGFSSGAHLSLLLALQAEEGGPSSDDPVERQSASIQAAAAVAPVTDLTADDFGPVAAEAIASFLGHMRDRPGFALGLDSDRQASPLTHLDADDPPVLLIHGSDDDVVPVSQSLALTDAMEALRIPVEYIELDGDAHDERLFQAVLQPGSDELPSVAAIARWLD